MNNDTSSTRPADKPPVPSELPEPLIPLAWLIGTWVGVGLGQYPNIDDFRFGNEVRFWTDGRPFLYYQSLSWILDQNGDKVRPAASETGYWRPQGETVEALVTYSTGHLELMLGVNTVTQIQDAVITGARIELKGDATIASPTAKSYGGGERLYGLIGADLGWTYDMTAMGQGMQNHLSAQLKRASYLGDPQHFSAE